MFPYTLIYSVKTFLSLPILRSGYFRQTRSLFRCACRERFRENLVHRRKEKLVFQKEDASNDVASIFPDVNFLFPKMRTYTCVCGTGHGKLWRFPIDV